MKLFWEKTRLGAMTVFFFFVLTPLALLDDGDWCGEESA